MEALETSWNMDKPTAAEAKIFWNQSKRVIDPNYPRRHHWSRHTRQTSLGAQTRSTISADCFRRFVAVSGSENRLQWFSAVPPIGLEGSKCRWTLQRWFQQGWPNFAPSQTLKCVKVQQSHIVTSRSAIFERTASTRKRIRKSFDMW